MASPARLQGGHRSSTRCCLPIVGLHTKRRLREKKCIKTGKTGGGGGVRKQLVAVLENESKDCASTELVVQLGLLLSFFTFCSASYCHAESVASKKEGGRDASITCECANTVAPAPAPAWLPPVFFRSTGRSVGKYFRKTVSPRHYIVDPMLSASGNLFKCHEEVLYLQPFDPT